MIPDFLLEAARSLAEELLADVAKCKDRESHIRTTARANEAAALYNGLLREAAPSHP